MNRLSLSFLALAATSLVVGVGIGIAMGVAHDFGPTQEHAQLSLLGWASLALFGIVYRTWPGLAQGWLPRLHLAVSVPAALLFPVGIYLSVEREAPGATIGAALLWQAGALLFLANLARLALKDDVAAPEAEGSRKGTTFAAE